MSGTSRSTSSDEKRDRTTLPLMMGCDTLLTNNPRKIGRLSEPGPMTWKDWVMVGLFFGVMVGTFIAGAMVTSWEFMAACGLFGFIVGWAMGGSRG